jgi:hypothetical protein
MITQVENLPIVTTPKARLARLYKKLHRWPGLILSFVLLWFAFSGILLNHRSWFSGVDINRRFLPSNYAYRNWNNAAIKGNLILSPDTILLYGNIGIWRTDSAFSHVEPFQQGFPHGSDHVKIFDLHRTANGDLFAATLFGMYVFDPVLSSWEKLPVPAENERFTGIESIGDTVYAVNRSFLWKGLSKGIHTRFSRLEFAAPAGYDHKITLFATIWQIHSGEIFGLPGRFFVDFAGILTIFLSVTGIIYFFCPGILRRKAKRHKSVSCTARVSRWTLRWHNLAGAWTFPVLLLTFSTGIFLRPPLLLAIAKSRVAPAKHSNLDQPNPWYDKLRDILYDPSSGQWMVSTSEGIFHCGKNDLTPVWYENQPPVSVMGITVFMPDGGNGFLVGSFSGLFHWNPSEPEVTDFISGKTWHAEPGGRPVGDHKVTGIIRGNHGELYVADYDAGIIPPGPGKSFAAMPREIIDRSGMSLWNVALEIHTGRIFQGLLGDFYILLVPLAGLTGIMIVLSGYLLWRRRYRRK